MRRIATVLLLSVPATQVQADDCAALGLRSAFLTRYFCDALEGVAKEPGPGRGLRSGTDGHGAEDLPPWADTELIRDAYRADPRKTLELIKRIKGAGGLTNQ